MHLFAHDFLRLASALPGLDNGQLAVCPHMVDVPSIKPVGPVNGTAEAP